MHDCYGKYDATFRWFCIPENNPYATVKFLLKIVKENDNHMLRAMIYVPAEVLAHFYSSVNHSANATIVEHARFRKIVYEVLLQMPKPLFAVGNKSWIDWANIPILKLTGIEQGYDSCLNISVYHTIGCAAHMAEKEAQLLPDPDMELLFTKYIRLLAVN